MLKMTRVVFHAIVGQNGYLSHDLKINAKLSMVADQDGPCKCIPIQICNGLL